MGSLTSQEIVLIPWDPESTEHVERLYQQRVACGWDEGEVEGWRVLQRAGTMALQWVVLADSDPSKEDKLAKHVKAWPLEAKPIADTASSLRGKPRTPLPTRTFIPVGHISLNADDDISRENSYKITTFYVSSALRGVGLGRAAMDAVEHMAVSEPLCAKTLWLSTRADVQQTPRPRLPSDKPEVAPESWYARRGYVAYEYKLRFWRMVDPHERWVDAVFMRKNIT